MSDWDRIEDVAYRGCPVYRRYRTGGLAWVDDERLIALRVPAAAALQRGQKGELSP